MMCYLSVCWPAAGLRCVPPSSSITIQPKEKAQEGFVPEVTACAGLRRRYEELAGVADSFVARGLEYGQIQTVDEEVTCVEFQVDRPRCVFDVDDD